MAEDEDKEVSIYGHQRATSPGQNIGLVAMQWSTNYQVR